MFKTILLAYNGTKEGKSALLDCSEIAAFEKATDIHLLAVVNTPSVILMSESYMPAELLEAETKHGQEVLDEGVEHLKQLGFRATGHLAIGEPMEEIRRLANEVKVDLIVLGHNQNVPLTSRWWRGSVGKTLLDHSPCSVYVAKTRK